MRLGRTSYDLTLERVRGSATAIPMAGGGVEGMMGWTVNRLGAIPNTRLNPQSGRTSCDLTLEQVRGSATAIEASGGGVARE